MVLGRRALWRNKGKADAVHEGAGGEKDDIIVTDNDGDEGTVSEWEADGKPVAAPVGGTEKMEIVLEDGLELTVEMDSGEKLLNELGYKQELTRNLNFPQLFAIGLSTVTVFTGIVPFYGTGYAHGGPVGVVWFWWITVFFTHLIALSLAEISSSYPIAGSLYFWAAALAGPDIGPFAAWITGWLEFIGLSIGFGGVCYGGTQLLQYTILVATAGPDGSGGYLLNTYESFGITVAVIVVCGLLNSLPIKYIGIIASISAVWQIGTAVIVCIVLPAVAMVHQPASFALGQFNTDPSMPSAAYSVVVALQLSQYSLYAYDVVAHLAEETRKADVTTPVAMVSCLSTVSLLSWAVLVTLTFCIQNTSNIAGASQPVVQIIYDVFYGRYQSASGAVVILSMIYVAFVFGVFAGCLSASRAAYAISRDSGLPLSSLWRRVNRDRTPVNAVWLSCGIAILFCLPLLKDATLFFAITSLATVGWVGGYAVPIFFRLIQDEAQFEPGPFYLANYVGHLGRRLINGGALFFILYTVVIFLIPVQFPITATNFNYAPVAFGGVVILFSSWWFIDAHRWFVGPFQMRTKAPVGGVSTSSWFN